MRARDWLAHPCHPALDLSVSVRDHGRGCPALQHSLARYTRKRNNTDHQQPGLLSVCWAMEHLTLAPKKVCGIKHYPEATLE
jgi:hypothetical protein